MNVLAHIAEQMVTFLLDVLVCLRVGLLGYIFKCYYIYF